MSFYSGAIFIATKILLYSASVKLFISVKQCVYLWVVTTESPDLKEDQKEKVISILERI